jgi:hypothetical protein
MISEEAGQYTLFKDCLARRIIARSAPGLANDPTDSLDDFVEYIASELWPSLPSSIQNATHDMPPTVDLSGDDDGAGGAIANLPPSVSDSLTAYSLAADWDSARALVAAAVREFIKEACTPPPAWSSTRTDACELCSREVPLTYHHLIPRATHDKVRKRRWHPEGMLNSVAWLCRCEFSYYGACFEDLCVEVSRDGVCRPCHSVVHNVASNEELARNFYTMELLLEREDIRRWKAYAAKQRFGVRRG